MSSGPRRLRTRTALLGAALAVAVVAAACQPTKPPPPQNQHRDVLILGDSLAAGIGCQLGDPGQPSEPPFPSCPGRPGITVANGWLGACSITDGWLHLYGTAGTSYPGGPPSATNQPNCHNWRQLFPGVLNAVTPELVILMTGGWEIVDRWSPGAFPGTCSPANITNCTPGADRQWGSTNATLNTNAVNAYRSALIEAVGMFSSAGADVLIVNSPYINPPTPGNLPDPIYWEPYPQSPPTWTSAAHGYFTPQPWRAPNNATPYKSSENKVDAFNAALAATSFSAFPTDVRVFNLWDYVSPQIGADREFSTSVCVSTTNPLDLNVLRSNPSSCPGGSQLVAVRHPDGGHFLADGYLLVTEAMMDDITEMLNT